MIFKIIAFIAAAIPIFLFVRSIFFRRTTRINEGLREFKKQANLAVSIFLFLIVCIVVFAGSVICCPLKAVVIERHPPRTRLSQRAKKLSAISGARPC
jgi:hypothetical protein